jgi:uncharacterized membrane protein
MSQKNFTRQLGVWGIPALYAATALVVGLTLPRVEGRIFPGVMAQVSVSAAMAIYSSIASGMIALTGIVFSLADHPHADFHRGQGRRVIATLYPP